MHWADQIADDVIKSGQYQPYWVDDMKTPSGRVHVGALRGVLIHDLVFKALQHRGVPVRSTYVFNDMDTMDSLPNYLDKTVYEAYMGAPFHKIPAPDKAFKNYAIQFAQDFIEAFTRLGATPEIVWSHELYESGKMNDAIKTALDNVEKIRAIYLRVAKQKKPNNWYPFQVICPQCGKLGTTLVDGWDGEKVHFQCVPDLVTWAKGCGYEGTISPFNGTGKLMWKIDWPAHWKVLGITIEGAGKDHSSEGGSRDIAQEVLKEVYDIPEPYDIPYEWFLVGGRKMSSSKGVGTSAREFCEILPPSIGRFLFVKTKFSRQMNFDPSGMTIPDLYDDYDKMAEDYWSEEKTDYARIFELSQIGETMPKQFMPRFRDVARIIQDPKLDPVKEFGAVKGEPLSDAELETLNERIGFAKIWLENYAPEEMVFKVGEAQQVELSEAQKTYLTSVVELLNTHADPEVLQQALYTTAKSQPLPPKDAFAAIYQTMIGKTHGPKAAWLLLENKDTAIEKFTHLDNSEQDSSKDEVAYSTSEHISLSKEFCTKYPSATIGYALIQGINVQQFDQNLEQERQDFLKKLTGITTDQLNQYSELISYRQMYKSMGVDWHSRRPSPEALLRRIATGKGLYPPINTCVDAYNLIVMKLRVSAGAFDADKMKLPVEVKIAEGGESGFFIGDKDEPTVLKAGEVSYFDQVGPYNMDYNYRDALRSAVNTETKNIWINTEGIYDISPKQVLETLEATIAIIQKFCGGTVVEKGLLKAK